ncbi:MAG: hypothetical protein R2784_13050 [Saprospiraceae bacterium]
MASTGFIIRTMDGRLGLPGMINEVMEKCISQPVKISMVVFILLRGDYYSIAKLISTAENNPELYETAIKPQVKSLIKKQNKTIPVLGITGTGGANQIEPGR